MRPQILIFGAGQVAETAAQCFETDGQGEIVAFAVDPAYHDKDCLMGKPVLTTDEATKQFPAETTRFYVAMGYRNHASAGWDAVQRFKGLGYRPASYVSPRASVAKSARLGDHVFIMDFNVIQPEAVIGDGAALMPQNNIGHHAEIGEAAFLSGQVCISGATKVGRGCFFGVQSGTADNVTIGDDAQIGAGAIVGADLPNKAVLVARPARRMETAA